MKYDEKGRETCPSCGAPSTKSHKMRVVKGRKWLYARRKIKLREEESREQIRKMLIESIREPPQEFATREGKK